MPTPDFQAWKLEQDCVAQNGFELGLDGFLAWSEKVGVHMDVSRESEQWALQYIERGQDVPKGSGRYMLEKLLAFADAQERPAAFTLLVCGGNSVLEDYYASFGFQPVFRDEETSDLLMKRPSLTPSRKPRRRSTRP